MEGGRNHRGGSDERSRTSAGIDTTEDEHIKFHGVPEGEKRIDDIRSSCKPEI
jgi:hypothetical protein